jgi:hypothetical protein
VARPNNNGLQLKIIMEVEVAEVVVDDHVTDAKARPIMLEIALNLTRASAILVTRSGIFLLGALIRLKCNNSRRAGLQPARSVDWQVMWPARARNYQRRT